MNPIRPALALSALALLAACGHSDRADESVSAGSVEMPAEQALSGVEAAPVADPSAASTPLTTEGVAANAAAAAADVAAAAGEAAPQAATAKKPL
jgi:hypothetical protein